MTGSDSRVAVRPGRAGPAVPELAGFSVGITCDRRAADLAAALERHGARVLRAPTLHIVPLADDAELLAATRACLDHPPDDVIVTTGIGLRGWIDAAESAALGARLHDVLGAAKVLTRGPKARGAVRAAGLAEVWSAPSESTEEVVAKLIADGVAGRRIAIQLHGEPLPEAAAALRDAGADVLEVPVYRWAPAPDPDAVRRLIDGVCRHQIDAVTFTSAPAAAALLRAAHGAGQGPALCLALTGPVLAASVGPVTSAPLREAGITPIEPARARMGALVRTVVEALPARASTSVHAAGHLLEVRGRAAVVDGALVTPPPAAMSVLRALAVSPGHVVARDALRSVLPGDDVDAHAVEVAVGRLRTALGDPAIVRTAVKRGYQLAVDDPP